ncbi:MAG: hypothetical protein CBB72_004945 [Muricauda sp. TMED12]|jgi:hypothetical protein|nr:MAG: hypothetical protein CBB72_004945 [Muricauda sp. TMED12]
MSLLLREDYEILEKAGLKYEEVEEKRFLIIKNFPLKKDLYSFAGNILEFAEILIVIPANYNTSGNNMLWTYPELKRTDGKAIPAAFGFGQIDARHHDGKEYCRWSRHYKPNSWSAKVDNIQKILDRVEWALSNPDANKL